jgi:hypothetical protein
LPPLSKRITSAIKAERRIDDELGGVFAASVETISGSLDRTWPNRNKFSGHATTSPSLCRYY